MGKTAVLSYSKSGALGGGIMHSKYLPLNGGYSYSTFDAEGLSPVTGYVKNLRFWLSGASLVNCTVTLFVESAATAVQVTIPGGATYAENLTSQVAISAGDRLLLYFTGDNTALLTCYCTLEIDSGDDNFGVIMSGGTRGAAGATGYFALNQWNGFGLAAKAIESEAYSVAPINCVIDSLYIRQARSGFGAADTARVTLRVNGADTTLTAIATGPGGEASDSTRQIAITKGDYVNWKVAVVGTQSCVISLGARVTPATPNGHQAIWITGCPTVALNALNSYYLYPLSIYDHWCATVGHHELALPEGARAGNLYVRLSGAPGLAASGKAYTFTLFRNGVATALTCTVLEIATAAEDAINVIDMEEGDLITLEFDPTNAPNVVYAYWGLVLYGSAPTITSIIDNQGAQASTFNLTINGTNLEGAYSVDMGAGITAVVSATTATSATVAVTIESTATLGLHDVTVETSSGTVTLANGFTVIANVINPSVSTAVPTAIASSQATLNGSVDENAGEACEVWFEWGSSTQYGAVTPKQPISYKGTAFSATISPLASARYYHARAVMQCSQGLFRGRDVGFATLVPEHLPSLVSEGVVRQFIG